MELPDLWATRYHALAAIAARGTNVFMRAFAFFVVGWLRALTPRDSRLQMTLT